MPASWMLLQHVEFDCQAEEAERRTLIANRDVSDATQDLVKLRRIRLSLQCAPRSLDLHVAVGTAAQKAVSVVGQDALVEVSSSLRLENPCCIFSLNSGNLTLHVCLCMAPYSLHAVVHATYM